ncbi:hypothetical protein Rs2_18359 [Raphanus sativus]|uniref:Uncharacterized protein LOC108852564 n=1 Tax=Raphanus sativus TaxID=3726 RepID=A0A6J0NBL2_RAPSA|nr:uncharacterized protein LOC108852564 [Raphanus sativus]KAJ4904408.1 hypothetical protein Rs2_18359 [Raphanus sativus]
MNKTKFDVPPFLLLEASADSDGGGTIQIHGFLDDGESIDKSCSASLYETSCVTGTSLFHPEEEDTVNEERIFTAVAEEDDEDGEGEVNSYIRCGMSQLVKLSVDSTQVVSEMDKSRMFWEACLAS